MAMRLVVWGHPAMAVALLLAFHCYLRIGELLRVEARDYVPASPRGLGNSHSFLHIPKAKTGAQQDVIITDPEVAWLLALAVRAAHVLQPMTAPGFVRVFPYGERVFRSLFAQCAASYGIPRQIVPHSMRHGGATHDFVSGARSADEVRIRGRWRMEKSMQHYVGAMRSALATLHVPERAMWCGAALADDRITAFRGLLALAPATPEVRAFRSALVSLDGTGGPGGGESALGHWAPATAAAGTGPSAGGGT